MESPNNTLQQLMFSLIEIWKGSDKSQQEFCKEKDLDYHKFQYWFRKYKAIHFPDLITDKKFSFKEIKLKPQPSAPAVELVFPDGRKIIFHQPVEAAFLRSLLH